MWYAFVCPSVLHYVSWPMDAISYQNKLDVFSLNILIRAIRNRFLKRYIKKKKKKKNSFASYNECSKEII